MATLTRRDWIIAAAERLGAEGVAEVKVEPLAAQLGVSKGSFYWHFSARRELLDAVLDMWERVGTERIIAEVDATGTDPQARVHELIGRVFSATTHDDIELGIRAWAKHDETARTAVARVDARRVGYTTELLKAAGVPGREARFRAEIVYRTLVGEFVLHSGGADPLPRSAHTALADWLMHA